MEVKQILPYNNQIHVKLCLLKVKSICKTKHTLIFPSLFLFDWLKWWNWFCEAHLRHDKVKVYYLYPLFMVPRHLVRFVPKLLKSNSLDSLWRWRGLSHCQVIIKCLIVSISECFFGTLLPKSKFLIPWCKY